MNDLMSKRQCLHAVGYNPYESELLEVPMCLNDEPANIAFNYCPWCGIRVDKIPKYNDDCVKGGCED